MSYFSKDYAESRAKFRGLVQAHGGVLESITHPDQVDFDGTPLTVDIARFGPAQAARVFFSLNGVHGNESYSGAAGQLQLIDSGRLDDLPAGVAAVLVHNINPFGWSRDSQLNENGVNLNRNFLDFGDLPKTDVELFAAMQEAMKFRELSLQAAAQAAASLDGLRERFGDDRYWSVLMTGQYSAPRALNYGGVRPEWSNATLRQIAARHLEGAEKVGFIDWHTGVGDYGRSYELHIWQAGSPQWNRLSDWWGADVVARGGQGVFSGEGDQAPTSSIRGLAQSALFDARPEAEFCGGVVEFGTVPMEDLFPPCIIDIWLRFDAPDVDPRPWKSFAQFAFAPITDRRWQSSVLEDAERRNEQLLSGLMAWSGD